MKNNIQIGLIIAGIVLIVLNIIYTSDSMDLGFWLRIITNICVILAGVFSLKKT